MFRRTSIPGVALADVALSPVAGAAIVPTLVQTPMPASATAADPALNYYQRLELRVAQTGEHFASGELQITLQGIDRFYTPPSGDSSVVRTDRWATFPNLSADTAITTPDSYNKPLDADGNFDPSHITILGGATFPVNHGALPVVMPSLANGSSAIDIAWGDTNAAHSAFGDGTYVIAVITVDWRQPEHVVGRFGGTRTTGGVPFDFILPIIPEPAALALLAIGVGTILPRRVQRR